MYWGEPESASATASVTASSGDCRPGQPQAAGGGSGELPELVQLPAQEQRAPALQEASRTAL